MSSPNHNFGIPCILLIMATLTLQVDITMQGLLHPQMTQRCPNHPPGQCCRSLGRAYGSELVHFLGLLPLDLAAVWDQRMPNMNLNSQFAGIQGCSGVPAETKNGPGNWHFSPSYPDYDGRAEFEYGVHGASYITMPNRLPPDPAISLLQAAQGGRAFVWGGGSWFASHGASSSRIIPRSLARRGIISALKGTYYWTTPPRWTWPTFVTVNGTEYTDSGTRSLIYKSAGGEILDLRHLAS